MPTELHIHIHPDAAGAPEDILEGFPFAENQSIMTYTGGVVIIDLAGAEDTDYMQEWFLNRHDDVLSFYLVDD